MFDQAKYANLDPATCHLRTALIYSFLFFAQIPKIPVDSAHEEHFFQDARIVSLR